MRTRTMSYVAMLEPLDDLLDLTAQQTLQDAEPTSACMPDRRPTNQLSAASP